MNRNNRNKMNAAALMLPPESGEEEDEDTKIIDRTKLNIPSREEFLKTEEERKVKEKKEKKARIEEMRSHIKKNFTQIKEERQTNIKKTATTYDFFADEIIPVESTIKRRRILAEINEDIVDDKGKVDIEKWTKMCDREELPLLSSHLSLDEIISKIDSNQIEGAFFSSDKLPAYCLLLTKDGYLVGGHLETKSLESEDSKRFKSVSTLIVLDYFKAMKTRIKERKLSSD